MEALNLPADTPLEQAGVLQSPKSHGSNKKGPQLKKVSPFVVACLCPLHDSSITSNIPFITVRHGHRPLEETACRYRRGATWSAFGEALEGRRPRRGAGQGAKEAEAKGDIL